MFSKKGIFYVGVAFILILAIVNAGLNIYSKDWVDLGFSLCLLFFVLPLPENLRFLQASLLDGDTKRTRLVSVLHLMAALMFTGGVIGNLL